MIKNYLKVAWRTLWRNKFFSILNITGLAFGLVCSLLIMLWVQSELDVDSYHANNDRLYKVYEREYYDHRVDGNYDTPALMADELKKVLPEVEYAVNMQDYNNDHTFKAGSKVLRLNGTYAGADLFKMFTYPLVKGDPQNALAGPLSIAISNKVARSFFGNADAAIGKTIRVDSKKDLIVSAVFKDLPANTSRTFEYLMSWSGFFIDQDGWKDWSSTGPLTFIQLRKNADPELVNTKLTHFLDHYQQRRNSYRLENGIQKYNQVYLHSSFDKKGSIAGGRIEYVNLFSLVAIFIMIIACINFMNLTTARSVKRAREIGVRKVVGAERSTLIRQFIGESFLLTGIAVSGALLLMTSLLPVFNDLTQKQLRLPFNEPVFWLRLLVITVLTGVISGSYPALFLSSFNPVKVLKGALKLDTGTVFFRKGLVVFQFVLSSILIIATIIVSKQVHFIQTRNLGYDRENLIYIPDEGMLATNYEVFRNNALAEPSISSVSRIGNTPTFIDNADNGIVWDKKDPSLTVAFYNTYVGYDWIKTMKLKLVAGRDFSKNFPADSNNFLINETALGKIGYSNPIGRSITGWGVKGKIVGVIKDFHFRSLHEPILPLILRLTPRWFSWGTILVRVQPGKTAEALSALETLCKKLNPDFTFSYKFSDQEYLKLYQSEQVAGKLSRVFAFFSIVISCLGLLGLAMFTAEQRVKEIGIRKVLGASIGSIFGLLSTEFLMLVCISTIIASPLAWLIMDGWLQTFAYRTSIDWWIFAISGLMMIAIALATVSVQSLKAALVNPIKSMRTE